MFLSILKWASLPVLLVGSLFSHSAERYELLLSSLICMGAIIVVQQAVWRKEYPWAAAFVVIAMIFSPLTAAVKIFLLLAVICVATSLTLLAAFRMQPLPRS